MNTQNRFLHASVFAFLAGVCYMIIQTTTYMAGQLDSPLKYLGLVISIGALVWAQLHWRNKVKGGYMTYGQAFGYSMMFTIASTIITLVWSIIFFMYIAPDFGEKLLSQTENKMIDQGLPQEQIDMVMRMTRNFLSPGMMITFGVIGSAVGGVILGLIVSAFTRKNPDPFLEQQAQQQQFYQNQQGWAQQQQQQQQNPFQQNQPPQNPNQQQPPQQ